MTNKKHVEILNCLFDIICKNGYEKDSRKKLDKFLRSKNIEVDNIKQTIQIGKKFVLTLKK